MFESVVASILNRVLGSFVQGFDSKQLNIGIWGGDVKLHNLRLRKESVDKLELPIEVSFGYIGELALLIPWSNLKSKPVKITIEDVYLYVTPMMQGYDEKKEKEKELRLKFERLRNLEEIEKLNEESKLLTQDVKSNESFVESLVTKVVDNLQVTIKNIHFRYEDDSVLTESPYSFGIKLQELSAVSTDDSWVPSFILETQKFTHKLLTLRDLSCYLNTDSESIHTEDVEKFVEFFKNTFSEDSFTDALQYLLKPISGQGKLTVNKLGATDLFPHVKAELDFEEFGLDLDSKQYKDILYTASKFHWYKKTYKFRKLRPTTSVKENPKEWFRYAARSILNEVHEKNYKWTWAYFEKRMIQRKAYIKLWKSSLLGKLTPEESQELHDLEVELLFEDIKFYRSLAKHQLKKELKTDDISKYISGSNSQNKGGWFSSWWGTSEGSKDSNKDANQQDSVLDIHLTEDQKKAFYDTIEYDETKSLPDSIDVPKDRVKFEVRTSLTKGGLSIRRHKGEENLAEVVFEGCESQYYQRQDSFLANFQLDEFRVEDGTKKTLYKHVVSVKQPGNHSDSNEFEEKESQDPFFKVSFENNPLDEEVDSRLLAKLKSMSIFHNPYFIEEVYNFFRPPRVHLDTLGAILNAAEATMEDITTQTRIGLQYALEEHKTIDVQLDLQAPLIILPLNPASSTSPVAILDAGHISVISNFAERSHYAEIKDKESYTESDWKRLSNIMYDQYFLDLQDAQILIGPNIQHTMLELHSKPENDATSNVILDKLNVKLLLGISILPDAISLAKFKISGEVPSINVSISDYQYKTLMKIIDTAIPNLEDTLSDNESAFIAYNSEEAGEISDYDGSEIASMDFQKSSKSQALEALQKQHMFEFKFRIGLANILLSRSISSSNSTTEPLVKLVGDSLSLLFFKTIVDMNLVLNLDDLSLIDYMEKSGVPEFEKLVCANDSRNTPNSPKKPLFHLEYQRTQRMVDFNNKEIEIYDQNIKVDMATVKLIISRTSILNLLNFALNTFTDPNALPSDADELKHNNSNDESSPQKINCDINLESLIMVLNDDGLKLATLELSSACFSVFLVPEEMEVNGKLEGLSMHDEINQGSPRDSILRNLVSIDDGTLAEFKYKTLDRAMNTNLFDSILNFKTGSARVNFIEESWCKIFNFLSQFQRMKAIYDSARDAAINQAAQIETEGQLKFDILIQAPVVVFPRLADHSITNYDNLTLRLGELFASNSFTEDSNGSRNLINAGIRRFGLSTLFYFDDVKQYSEILDNLDISFDIDYSKDFVPSRPMFDMKGRVTDFGMHLTELQLAYLLDIVNSVSAIFNASNSMPHYEEIELEAANANAAAKEEAIAVGTNISGERNGLAESGSEPKQEIPSDYKKLNFEFSVPKISLSLYNRTRGLASFELKKLSCFALNGLFILFEMNEDTHFVSDVKINSFIVQDTREHSENRFREIIPLIDHGSDQFKLKIFTNGSPEKKYTTCMLNVDTPKVILALDYIFELLSFLDVIKTDSDITAEGDKADEESLESSKSEDKRRPADSPETNPDVSSNVGFSINIKDPSIILLADSTKSNTEAIVFKVEQILITSQNIQSIAASNIGMFLCSMNETENRQLRIIDDFSISFAYDSRGSDSSHMMAKISASVDPVVMRLSLRDIRLAISTFNNATELYKASIETDSLESTSAKNISFSEGIRKRVSEYAPSIISKISNINHENSILPNIETVLTNEDLSATFGGLRFVLIGDIHELPVLDINVKPFEAKAVNWSTDLSAECHVESYVNVFNYSRSTWEPMIEPLPVSFYVSRVAKPNICTIVEIYSRQLSEVTISSRSVATLSQIFSLITAEEDLRERDNDDPYVIINETGYDILVWIDKNDGKKENETLIKNNGRLPWSFEDWRVIRENLDSDNKMDVLGISLVDSPYQPLTGISADGEGEDLFALNPPIESIHSRLSCEIKLQEDLIKTIWLKSTVKFQNDSDVTIQVQVANNEKFRDLCMDIEPSSSRSVPIDCVYSSSFKIRPKMDTNFDWSKESLYWKDTKSNSLSLTCPLVDDNGVTTFNFHSAFISSNEPLAKIYPHLTFVVSAPVEIINLLPFDFDYRLYDKTTRKDWKGTISKGENAYIHVVNLRSLLLLSVEPKSCGFKRSEFAIINSAKDSEFNRESIMTLAHEDGQILKLKIHYPKNKPVGSGLRISVYSPYVILNRTSQNLIISEKGNSLYSKGKHPSETIPMMFSFDKQNDRSNRALLKAADSSWSPPISFDAIGQSHPIKAQISGKQTELDLGISITEGEGKYNLTKVIDISPRYVIRNLLSESLEIVENGSTKIMVLHPNDVIPLYGLRRIPRRTVLLKFLHSKNWSSPFCIEDVGQVFLKVYKENLGQVLLKINIVLENATIFLQVEDAKENWPFSIRNFSDQEFYIYQSDPNVNESGDKVRLDADYEPIYYKIPPKSSMPYAYDYPDAVIKELIIRSHGRERAVNLAEIGNLKPFRLPPTQQDSKQIIVDLNVIADGPTQSLVVSNYDPSVSLYKLQKVHTQSQPSIANLSNTSQVNFLTTEEDNNYHTKIVLNFEGFGFSLINTRSHELCYITLRGLEIRYNESDLYQNLSLKLKWIQIDNQLFGGIFPIVLYPSVIPKSAKEMNQHPSFSASICKVKDDSHGVIFFKYATMLLQEMTFEIDEDFLFALLDFAKFPGASWNRQKIDKLCDDNLKIPEPAKVTSGDDLYFEALHLQPTSLNLSFVRTERVNAEDKGSSQNTLMFFVNVLTMAIGNINDAPIRLNALFIENIRTPLPLLVELVETHYGQAFFYQVHKVLGSADFLGNPVGLFNNLSSGVLDIFYEPYQGFIINDRPQELGIGIAKGGLSFLKKSIFGFSDSVAKVTGSIAKGLSVVTLDEKFQERRRLNQRRNKPKHALYGFASGANSFFESFSSGVSGLATSPLEGANREGTSGFFRGIGKGLVGLPTKTAIGFFDLASNVSEGIRNTTTVFDAEGLDKVRLPRYISYDKVIRPYDQREAQGQYWLKSIDGGLYFAEEYLAHLILPGEQNAIIVTFNRIILFEINLLKTIWSISLDQIKSISNEVTGISITLKRKEGPFIPISDKASRSFLYNRIGVAVQEFNKHCQVTL